MFHYDTEISQRVLEQINTCFMCYYLKVATIAFKWITYISFWDMDWKSKPILGVESPFLGIDGSSWKGFCSMTTSTSPFSLLRHLSIMSLVKTWDVDQSWLVICIFPILEVAASRMPLRIAIRLWVRTGIYNLTFCVRWEPLKRLYNCLRCICSFPFNLESQ